MDRDHIISQVVSNIKTDEEAAIQLLIQKMREKYTAKINGIVEIFHERNIQFEVERHNIELPLHIQKIPIENASRVSIKETHVRDGKILICARYPQGDSFKEIDINTQEITDSTLNHDNFIFGKIMTYYNDLYNTKETETHVFIPSYDVQSYMFRNKEGVIVSSASIGKRPHIIRSGASTIVRTSCENGIVTVHDIANDTKTNFFRGSVTGCEFIFRGRYYRKSFFGDNEILESDAWDFEGRKTRFAIYDCLTGLEEPTLHFLARGNYKVVTGNDCIFYVEDNTTVVIVK